MNSEIDRQFQCAEWAEIGKELTLFAENRFRIYFLVSPNISITGAGAEDVAQQVIMKTIARERRWDPAKGPLMPWLKDQVKSVVDARVNSAANRHEEPLFANENDKEPIPAEIQSQIRSEMTPEEQVLSEEDRMVASKQIALLLGLIADKPELEEIVLALWEGCERKPKTLAKELGADVKDINNRLKRLKRLALKEIRND